MSLRSSVSGRSELVGGAAATPPIVRTAVARSVRNVKRMIGDDRYKDKTSLQSDGFIGRSGKAWHSSSFRTVSNCQGVGGPSKETHMQQSDKEIRGGEGRSRVDSTTSRYDI